MTSFLQQQQHQPKEPSVVLEDEAASTSAVIPQRKKLQLKPRSSASEKMGGAVTTTAATNGPRQRSLSSKGNPFGAAVPREEILRQRGIDVSQIDGKFERKAAVRIYTPAQEAALEAVRAELSALTASLRHANEHELPEEVHRKAEETKRQELNELVEKFDQLNTSIATANESSDEARKYGPSRTRPHRDHHESSAPQLSRSQGNRHSSGGGNYYSETTVAEGGGGRGRQSYYPKEEKTDDNDAYAAFYSNRRRHPRTEEEQED